MKRGTSGLNMLIAIDKPAGMTSHDVVNRVRRYLGERRVGHAGTLDPAATGVLLVGVGQGTRLMGLLTTDEKSYVATIAFGAETSTDDAEGEVVRTAPLDDALKEETYARRLLNGMRGRQQQVPPAYSAISVDGKRAYARARSGEKVDLPARDITIFDADLLSIECDGQGVLWNCAFRVSKGTYIRSVARDLGRMANCAAHLLRLCRTMSGIVSLRDCVSLDEVERAGADGAKALAIDPVHALGHPVRELTPRERKRVCNGSRIPLGGLDVVEGSAVTLVGDDLLWGVWKRRGDGLQPMANFPQGISGVRR